MALVNRKITYKIYPNKNQCRVLRETVVLHQRLCNACLEYRILVYRWGERIRQYRDLTEPGKLRLSEKLTYYGQLKQRKTLREELPEYATLSQVSLELPFHRLDRVYQNFLRRHRQGAKGRQLGFPRRKALDRYPRFGFRKHGNGWRFTPGPEWRHGKLRIKGIDGAINCRGRARTPGTIKTCELLHRDGVWHMSLTVACEPYRKAGNEATGLDWSVSTFATVVGHDGAILEIENPHHLDQARRKLLREQRSLSRTKRGSLNRRKQRVLYGRAFRHLANSRRDFQHQVSKRLVDRYGLIATEKLTVKKLTASAKGTAEKSGTNVKAKAGLNRRILDTAPDAFLQKLRYKVQESGEWVEVPTRKVKPSQTCPSCGQQRKKALSKRIHKFEPCGYTEPRDQAAARVMLNWALTAVQRKVA